MKKSELKSMIRGLVRECVHEMLAEKFIESSMHEIVGNRQPLQEAVQARTAQPKKKAPVLSRQQLIEKYGFDEGSDMMQLFEDTQDHNPILNGHDADAPGTISESAMEKIGIMTKDWTKLL